MRHDYSRPARFGGVIAREREMMWRVSEREWRGQSDDRRRDTTALTVCARRRSDCEREREMMWRVSEREWRGQSGDRRRDTTTHGLRVSAE